MTDESVPGGSRGASRRTGVRRRSAAAYLRDILIVVVVAVLVSFLVKSFILRSFSIPSASMQNTLQINDRVLVDELEPGIVPISRGDVVVFTDPGGWLPRHTATPPDRNPVAAVPGSILEFVGLSASDSGDHLIKRVIGLPGDHVTCCTADGRLTVDGAALTEPYTQLPPGESSAATLGFDVTVPRGELWVMGDNRYDSQDSSRNQNLPGHGFVPVRDVVGRAFVVSWPLARWNWLDNYPDVFRGAEEEQR